MTRKRLRLRTLRPLGVGLLLIASVASISSNCSVYDESLLQQPVGAGGTSGAAGTGGNNDSSSEATPPCDLTHAPSPPASADPGPDLEPFVVAFSRFDFGDKEGPDGGRNLHAAVGFDIDNNCTATPQESPCIRPDWANGDIIDDPGGIDNALGKVIQFAQDRVPGFGSGSYTKGINEGITGVLVRISGYNGQANDDRVQTDIYVPAPMNSFPQAPRQKPLWDGLDEWPISSDCLEGGDINKPIYRSTTGYVNNWQMVTNMDLARLRITTALTQEGLLSKLEVNFIKAFVVARVETLPDGKFALREGTLGGRWRVQDLIGQLGQFVDPDLLGRTGEVVPLCPPLPYHEIFRDNICALIDVASDPLASVLECDALSVGIGFEALPARLGNVFKVNDLKNPCAAGRDPGAPEYFCGKEVIRVDGGRDGSGGTSGFGGRGGSGGSGGSTGGSGGSTGGTGGMDATSDSGGSDAPSG